MITRRKYLIYVAINHVIFLALVFLIVILPHIEGLFKDVTLSVILIGIVVYLNSVYMVPRIKLMNKIYRNMCFKN